VLSSRHIIDIQDLTPDDITLILDTADSFKEVNLRRIKKLPTLRGRTIVNLFLEPSTRTRTSFEIAAKRLSADGLNFSASTSATVKGESLADTAETLSAMACDLVIIRHKYAGSPRLLTRHMDAHIINGGDGMHQHPTQALLDLYTMRERLGHLEGLTVGVVGDIAHSRVAGSLVPALRMVGATPVLVGPPTLMPARADGMPFPSLREYSRIWGMNEARLARMKPAGIVMHPGPMNRGVEISSAVADSDRAVVLDQVNAGVAVRMAAMYLLLGGDDGGAAA
jgi:aspartate carbamoyltransferase catalytic subunit